MHNRRLSLKFRHGAALALVGWYLMVPPLVGLNAYNSDAPLNTWKLFLSFDSAAECEAFAADRQKNATDSDVRNAARESKCIASDDPRLKDK